jgi:hypothetical protein
LQAMQWHMNPYAVAQKTHLTKSGALGYEAQLVNAAIITSGKIKGAPEYEFLGDWDKILGKVEERSGQGGGKYYVAAWNIADEVELGVICTVNIIGESKPRQIKVMMTQAWPRFSTQWATDPQQQITYLAVRKLARRYMPDVLLGVYSQDELEFVERVDDGASSMNYSTASPTPAAAAPVDTTSNMPKRRAAPAPEAEVSDATITSTDRPREDAPPPSSTPAPRPAASTPVSTPTSTIAGAADGEDDGVLATVGHKTRLETLAKACDKNLALVCSQLSVRMETLTVHQFNRVRKAIEA